MDASTPWQLGLVSEMMRALARDDRVAMARWTQPRAPLGWFSSGVDRIAGIAATGWCREALEPWRDPSHPGPRTLRIRADAKTTLACFAERGDRALVLVVDKTPDAAKLRDVREMPRAELEAFGEIV